MVHGGRRRGRFALFSHSRSLGTQAGLPQLTCGGVSRRGELGYRERV
jgi:hypothetical protein